MSTELGQSLGAALGQFAFGSNTRSAGARGMLDGARAGAYDANREQSLASRLKLEAEAELLRRQSEAQSPENLLRSAATAIGVPLNDLPAVKQYQQTGELGGRYAPAVDGFGPVAPQPDWAKQLPAMVRSLGNTQRAITLGDKSVENAAKADAIGREEDVLSGRLDPALLAQAQFSRTGNSPFKFEEFGTGNNVTGKLDDTTGPALRLGDKRKAETRAQDANARQSDAAAGASRASAEKTRQETELGGKGVLVQTADGPVFASPRDGKATPVTVNGQPAKLAKQGGNMSATLQKELVEADDLAAVAEQTANTLRNALKINGQAYSGVTATLRAKVRSNLPGQSPDADATVELNNMIGEQALSGMKAIFGGNPTEGERAILLDLQASADKLPQQREKIIKRGIELAERRMRLNRERAKSIRSGTYLTDGPEAAVPPAATAPPPAAGGLSEAEQQELDSLRARFGKKP